MQSRGLKAVPNPSLLIRRVPSNATKKFPVRRSCECSRVCLGTNQELLELFFLQRRDSIMDCNNPYGPDGGLKAPSALSSPGLAFTLMVPFSISQTEDTSVRHTINFLGCPCRLTKHLGNGRL